MTQRQAFVTLIAQSGLALAALVCATVLAAMGRIDGAAVTAIIGTAIGLVGPSTVSLGTAAINGGPRPDLSKLAASSPEASIMFAEHATVGKRHDDPTAPHHE
jgi:hypothetical protein